MEHKSIGGDEKSEEDGKGGQTQGPGKMHGASGVMISSVIRDPV